MEGLLMFEWLKFKRKDLCECLHPQETHNNRSGICITGVSSCLCIKFVAIKKEHDD